MQRTIRFLLATAMLTAATSIGIAGHAAAGGKLCEARTLSKAFAQFGDNNDYFLVDAADFETDGKGRGSHKDWKLPKKAKIVSEQAPWKVNGSKHSKALQIDSSTTVSTPEVCVMVNEEFFRFFYKDPGKSNAALDVTVTATSALGTATTSWRATSTDKGWKVSPPIALPNVRGENGEQQITISFATGSGKDSRWVIDDVMIDPWRTR